MQPSQPPQGVPEGENPATIPQPPEQPSEMSASEKDMSNTMSEMYLRKNEE